MQAHARMTLIVAGSARSAETVPPDDRRPAMRRTYYGTGILAAGVAVVLLVPGLTHVDSLSIGVETASANLGVHIEGQPPVAAVRGTRVYHAPSLPYNYFVYRHTHYLFHRGIWFSAEDHDGPWTAIAIERVPRPILGVPVTYYKNPPGYWKKSGPPPWAEARGHDKARGHANKPQDKEDDG